MVDQGVTNWQESGGGLVFVTFTIRHHKGASLDQSLHAVMEGFRKLQAGKSWVNFKAKWGIRGAIRAVEVTYGENGWHPHIHALFFVDKPLQEHEGIIWESTLYRRWAKIVEDLGAEIPNHLRGVDVRVADENGTVVGQYLAKLQDDHSEKRYGIGQEMTRFDFKAGRSHSLVPFELLDGATMIGDTILSEDAARHLWCEYVEATKGRRCITWSHGLKELLGVDDVDLTDEELIESTEQGDVAFLIPAENYDRIKNSPDTLARILEWVETGEVDQAMQFVGGILPEVLPPVDHLDLADAVFQVGGDASPLVTAWE